MRRINFGSNFKKDNRGISIAELLITISVISIVSILIMSFMVTWVEQYAISETRNSLLADAQNATDRIVDSIRLSSSADQNNRWLDPNAPEAPSDQQSWQSSASTLVLASAVEDQDGNIVFSDPANYTGEKNNRIYFVQDGALYQRTLAAPVANNSLKTSCPEAEATADCPKDVKLAENVSSFSVKYFDATNTEVSPTDSRSVELSLTLEKRSFSQLIQSVYKTRMVYRND